MSDAEVPMQRPNSLWRVFLILFAVTAVYYAVARSCWSPGAQQIPYSEFKEALREGRIESVTIAGQKIEGVWRDPKREGAAQQGKQPNSQEEKAAGQSADEGASQTARGHNEAFETVRPPFDDPELIEQLEARDVTVRSRVSDDDVWMLLLVSFLPLLFIVALIVYGARRMSKQMGQLGGGGMLGFGRSRAKRHQKSSSDIGFSQVAGLHNAKRDMQEIIDYLREPTRYRALGAKPPRGTLLMGPPGTGKTLLARACAGEANVPFFSISASEFIEMFVGVGASRVRDMFNEAKKEAPSIVFIDELDSVGRARGAGLGGGHDEREQTLNQILSEMDGFAPHEAVVVMAATNRPDVLDSALLRPGRFDRKIVLEMPHRDARLKILEVHAAGAKLAESVRLDSIAGGTVGFSGADLENLVNEAAMLAGRQGKDAIEQADFEEARDKIMLGERRDAQISKRERERVAYHEAGHAVVGRLLKQADPVRKVTIIPRGRSLGATEQTPDEERQSVTHRELLDRLTVMLAGRGAVRLVFNEITSGAADDLKQATQVARKMVTHWGMSERLGASAFIQGEEHVFLGREMTQQKSFSEATGRLIDEEIQRIVDEMDQRAFELLRAHRNKLERLAQALLEQETLDDAEITRVLGEAA